MADHLVLKWLHIVGAILLLGNVVVTGLWALLLFRNRHVTGLRAISRGIMWADVVFTLVGGVLLVATGIVMARSLGLPLMETPWIRTAIHLLGGATLLWVLFLVPDQVRMERVAPEDDARFRARLLDTHDVEIMGAFGPLAGRAWRVGTMAGNARPAAVLRTLGAIANTLGSPAEARLPDALAAAAQPFDALPRAAAPA